MQRLVEELPKTATGKITRNTLRDEYTVSVIWCPPVKPHLIRLGVHLNERWTLDGGTGRGWGAASNENLDERKRIVEEALASGVSVAAVARRHGLNANLIFKWIRRSREGWRDRRREPAKEKPVLAALPERGGSAFVPVKLLELDAASAPPPSDVAAKPARQTRRGARRGAMEISLPNGAKVSLDAEVDAEALRRVLSALGVA
jgi:transposase